MRVHPPGAGGRLVTEDPVLVSRDPRVGKRVGTYVLEAALGHGTLGRVYLAYDPDLDVRAAVKLLSADPGGRPDRFEDLLARAPSLLHLKHPHIVALRDLGRNGNPYLVMEYVEGLDLKRIVEEMTAAGKRLPCADVLCIVEDIARALDHAHGQGVLHGDLKSCNILVDQNGRATVSDFGIGAALRRGLQDWGPDSLRYLAPELALPGQPALPQTDLYSLGIILYEMLAGRVPFDDPYPPTVVIQHLKLTPPPPRQANPDFPPEVERVVLRALDKEPAARFPSGEALASALRQAMEAAGVHGRAQEPGPGRPDGIAQLVRRSLAGERRPPETSPKAGGARPAFPLAVRSWAGRHWRVVPWAGLGSCLVALCLLGALGLKSAGSAILGLAAAGSTPVLGAMTEAALTPTSLPDPPTAVVAAPASPVPLPTGASDPNVLIVYSASSVTVINASGGPISLAGVEFVRIAADGSFDASFEAAAWNTVAARKIGALPPRDCYMLLQLNQRISPPEPCQDAWGWIATSSQEWHFWLPSQSSLFFGVLHFGRVIHICPIADGRCTFYLPQPG